MARPILPCAVPHRVAAGGLLVPGLVVAGAVLAPGRVDACGASPSPTYTIAAVSPGSGSSGVARDAGIVVSGAPSLPSPGPSVFADVELIDADTDEALPLQSISWYTLGGSEETLAVHPIEPLEPQHRYRIEATPSEPAADGSPGAAFVSSFTTSEALLEPLVLTGELGLSLRGDEVDIVECGPCGQDCAATGTRRALLADVQLPAPSGGQGVYRGVLHFSDHTPTRIGARDPAEYETLESEPHEVHLTQLVKIEPGEALTLEQEIVEEAFAYAGCFTFVVWDPAGHVAQTSACLPSLSPDDIRVLARDDAPLQLASDEPAASEQVRSATADARDNGQVLGCALDASGSTTTPAWATLLLASLAALRRSRQRR